MDKYAVIGSPIKHSKSPLIHQWFAEQTQQALEYTAIEVSPEHFFDRINEFAAAGYKGLNITVPLKEKAWETADCCDELANCAQAVNTLVFEKDGQRTGYNTDGIGLLRDLTENHGISLKAKRILVLGAGGAVRGVLMPLIKTKPQQLVVANRTASKAHALIKHAASLGPVTACGLDDLGEQPFDIIINGTAAGLSDQIPAIPDKILIPGGITYDMLYSDQATAFVKWGQQHHASQALDGLGMLVEQAAESFRIWRKIKPHTKDIIHQLRSA